MRRSFFLDFIVVTVWLLCLSLSTNAAPKAGQFYLEIDTGVASLNNEGYLYGMEILARQPELAPEQSHQYKGPVVSVNTGMVVLNTQTNFLGSETLNISVQGGYTDFGEYTVNAVYPGGLTGYRILEESAADLSIVTSLYWENGFNLSAKAGVARLQGQYEQKGILSLRIPESNLDQTLSYVFYRPEIGARLGYLISDRVNVHVQFAHILGPEHGPAVSSDVENLPNTLYKVDSLTIGATYYW